MPCNRVHHAGVITLQMTGAFSSSIFQLLILFKTFDCLSLHFYAREETEGGNLKKAMQFCIDLAHLCLYWLSDEKLLFLSDGQ